jgi:lipoprotein-anchoring transpeptidase ErfK/SrfK
MFRSTMRVAFALFALVCVSMAQEAAPIAIEIDLSAQKAWVLQDGQRVYEAPICSGRTGHETPTGNFTVLEKDLDHKSSLYGRIVDSAGRVLDSDADSDMPVPAGAKFVPAPMRHFLRFDGAVGMHAGRLPGYPASHGCVRLPSGKAALFFNVAEIGMPVRVFGRAPRSGPPVAAKSKATPAPLPTPGTRGWFTWFKRDS